MRRIYRSLEQEKEIWQTQTNRLFALVTHGKGGKGKREKQNKMEENHIKLQTKTGSERISGDLEDFLSFPSALSGQSFKFRELSFRIISIA